MIRKATFDDIELIEDTYNEHFEYETEHGALPFLRKAYIKLGKMRKKLLMPEHYIYTKKIAILPEV